MIDLKLRAFIPSRAVLMPGPLVGEVGYDGDNRGFSYGDGTSRAELWVDADNSPLALTPITVKRQAFGSSAAYFANKLVDVPGKPFWWKAVRKVPFLEIEEGPDRTGTAKVTADSLRVVGKLEPTLLLPNLRVSFHVSGANPLEPLAPPFNCDLDVLLSATAPLPFSFSVVGGHDPFPAYELYIQGRLIYSYDPSQAGGNPADLFMVNSVRVNTPWSAFI